MPGCTKVMISPETVCRIADIPNVIGLKDSSADMFYFNKLKTYLANRPDFRILIGPEELLTESLLMGCDGGVSGGANIFPQLYVDLYNSVISGNAHKAKKLHKIIMKISSTIYNTGKYDSSIIKGIKCSLKILGICNDFIAEPFHKFQNSEYEKVRNHLEEILNSNEYKFFFSNKTNSKLSINSLTKNNRSLKTKPQNQYSS
jgi:4-hydroxy-tetrahydrodipicolinate synthase